jgi:uncharacterized membrane protein
MHDDENVVDNGTSGPEPSAGEATRAVAENVETIVRLEEAALRERTSADRLTGAIGRFVGSVKFIGLQLLAVAAWIAINLRLIPAVPAFDPYPFPLLCGLVSLEGVLLAAMVLIRQNRLGYVGDRRSHLDLQVNLLTEREVTRVLRMVEAIGHRLDIDWTDAGTQAGELGEIKALEQFVDELDRKLSS